MNCQLVTSGCGGRCGDGIIQAEFGEVCDLSALGEATCESEGYYEGTLACDSGCRLETTGCAKQCGDGIIQSEHGEDCEGSDLGGLTCGSLGYSEPRSGALACLAGCVFDESACVAIGDDADLATLTVSDGLLTPVFSPSNKGYGTTLPNSVLSVTVTATVADAPYATVAISPAQPMTLEEGANPVTVTVTAESGAVRVYTVQITRASTDDLISPHIGILEQVPGGTFQRDGNATDLSTVSAFRMSKYEVSRAQWVAVTGWADPSNPDYSNGMSDPVQMVNWYHAIAFCNKLSLLEGLTPVYTVSGVDFDTLAYDQIPTTFESDWFYATANWAADGYRLPTEMEWMWAAMGADTSAPGVTNTTGYLKEFAGSTGSNLIGDYAWHAGNSSGKTHPAGTKLENELGFHDLSGNVGEWVWDLSGPWPQGTVTDYRGTYVGVDRLEHGGDWIGGDCSIHSDSNHHPWEGYNYLGFRVVRQ